MSLSFRSTSCLIRRFAMGQVQLACVLRDKDTGRGCDCHLGPRSTPCAQEEDKLRHLRPNTYSEVSKASTVVGANEWLLEQAGAASLGTAREVSEASVAQSSSERWLQQDGAAAWCAREQPQQENDQLRSEIARLSKALAASTEPTWQVFDVVEQHYRDLEHHQQAKLRCEQHKLLPENLTLGYEAEGTDYDLEGDRGSQASAPSAASAVGEGSDYARCDRCCCIWQLPEPQGGVCPRCEAAVRIIKRDSDGTILGPTVHLISSTAALDRRSGTLGSGGLPWKPAVHTPGSSSSITASTTPSAAAGAR